jgi:hypothetical protein
MGMVTGASLFELGGGDTRLGENICKSNISETSSHAADSPDMKLQSIIDRCLFNLTFCDHNKELFLRQTNEIPGARPADRHGTQEIVMSAI